MTKLEYEELIQEILEETSTWPAVKAAKHYTEAVKCLSAGCKRL
jgi:hypothetical protein